MSESLSSRVGRIISGSFHALVDAVENAAPENVMEQAIREIETAIADVRVDLGKVEAQRHLSASRPSWPSSKGVMTWPAPPWNGKSISRRSCRYSNPV